MDTGIIYVTQNLINNKIYVGIHTKNRKDYLGSGDYLRNAIRKHGKENFKRTTIDEFDELEIGLAKERYWIEKLNSKWPIGYNLNSGGEGQFNPCKETREKMSSSKKGKPLNRISTMSDEQKAAASKRLKKWRSENPHPMLGRKQSKESCAKMSKSKKELLLGNEELRKKMGASHVGKPSWNAGKTMSEEHKKNLRLAHIGHKDSEETKKRKSIAATKAWAMRKNGQGGVLL